jgi:hypothetical protein
MIVHARIAAGIAAAAALGVVLTACGGSSGAAGPTASPTTDTAPAAVPAKQAATTATTTATLSQFPNKDLTVLLDGYDSSLHVVDFHLAVWQAGGPDDGHYVVDPSNSSAHRLPIATGASLTSLSPLCTGPSKGDPNTDGSTCTTAQFIAALLDDSGVGPATLHVNAQDQIQTEQEIYHP